MLRNNSVPSKPVLLNQINEVSFAVNDITLYLDTHPADPEALRYYRENMEHRKEFLKQYAENYGPLTLDSYACREDQKWLWEQQPFPWEMEGGCR